MFFLGRMKRWFRDRGRRIFRLWTGDAWRYYDPVAVGARIEELEPKYTDLLETLAKKVADLPPGPIRDDLIKRQRDTAVKLAALSRTVFNLPPMTDDGNGATDAEAVNAIASYFLFMEGLARDAELFPHSQGAA